MSFKILNVMTVGIFLDFYYLIWIMKCNHFKWRGFFFRHQWCVINLPSPNNILPGLAQTSQALAIQTARSNHQKYFDLKMIMGIYIKWDCFVEVKIDPFHFTVKIRIGVISSLKDFLLHCQRQCLQSLEWKTWIKISKDIVGIK